MVNLSKRLTMVANLLGEGNVICDVGCDHGYLSIWLVESGAYKSAIAMDINEGPLLKAKENIRKCNMESVIETRLSDGVNALKTNESDSVCICGMGGNVMMHIFDEGANVLRDANTIVLQPQSEYMVLYNYILLEGYRVVDEAITYEDGKYYFAWKLSYSSTECERLSDDIISLGFYYSRKLLEKRDEIYKDYLVSYYNSINAAISNLRANSPTNPRLTILSKEKETIEKSIDEYYN